MSEARGFSEVLVTIALNRVSVVSTPPLLIVEDSDEDFEAYLRYLRRSALTIPVYRCVNGDEAIAFLYKTGKYADPDIAPYPGLIWLDLNLPGTDGREVLLQIKQDSNLSQIPVVVFSTSNEPKDIKSCYEQGIAGYVTKPTNTNQLKNSIQTVLDYWFAVCDLPHSLEE
jgi:CheY-like chemotaxis protein